MPAANPLPPIPSKRYFTIGEVSALCDVKPHVLRYWEQEFSQLRPIKRQGNRRYYQRHEVFLIRRIRELLYDEGFTISGARNKIQGPTAPAYARKSPALAVEGIEPDHSEAVRDGTMGTAQPEEPPALSEEPTLDWADVRNELLGLQRLLKVGL
ncbi:MAG: hypothetical protein Fur007_12440 [Rhodoferax sp.]